MHGPTTIFWVNLTAFSLQLRVRAGDRILVEPRTSSFAAVGRAQRERAQVNRVGGDGSVAHSSLDTAAGMGCSFCR
jgi:hypothetical protein